MLLGGIIILLVTVFSDVLLEGEQAACIITTQQGSLVAATSDMTIYMGGNLPELGCSYL